MIDDRQLLHNSIQCPDGTILTSRHQHGFVEHTQEDGRNYFVDGGLSYQRIGFSDTEYTNLAVYVGNSHKEIRERFEWGTYGKNGDQPKSYIKLKDITEEHLEALVTYTKEDFPEYINNVFVDEVEYRWLKV